MQKNSFIHYFQKNKNSIAIIDANKKITYSDLIKFKEKYFKCKRKVFLLFSSDYFETIFLYSALLISENTIILVDFIKDKNYINLLIKKYKPNYVLLPKINVDKFLFNEKIFFCLKKTNIFQLKLNNNISYNSKNKLLLSTSGTTGSPKMVRLSEDNLFFNSQSICTYLKINKSNSCITTLPPSYSYAISIINSHLLSGAKIFINNYNIVNPKFWKFVQKNKITSLSFVPNQFEILANYNFFNKKLKTVKYMTSAGGRLNENVLNYLKEYSEKNLISFYIMYGQTEASPRISYYLLNKTNLESNCIGKPIKFGKLKILGKDRIGEIIYSGPNIFLGYAKNYLDLIKNTKKISSLRTGDIGYKDANGYFYILTRKKRIAKINGLRISLDHIEEILKKQRIIVKCYLVDEKINIYINDLKKRRIINSYLLNSLNLTSQQFLIKKKSKIIVRNK
jgi:long-chain acyl-CoA synthetase